jgi:hypothetical protein
METVRIRQERILTERTELRVAHCDERRFIINMHALHNAHLLREVLPRTLTAPVPYLNDRTAAHRRFASQLRETGPAKRAEIKAKTQATRERNKSNRVAIASAQARRQHAENDPETEDDAEDSRMDLDA